MKPDYTDGELVQIAREVLNLMHEGIDLSIQELDIYNRDTEFAQVRIKHYTSHNDDVAVHWGDYYLLEDPFRTKMNSRSQQLVPCV